MWKKRDAQRGAEGQSDRGWEKSLMLMPPRRYWSYQRLLLFLEGFNCYSWCCWLEQELGLVVFEVLDQAGIYWPSLLGVQAHRGISVSMEEDFAGGWSWSWFQSNLQPHTYCVSLYACSCAERPLDTKRHLCLHLFCYHRGLQKKATTK